MLTRLSLAIAALFPVTVAAGTVTFDGSWNILNQTDFAVYGFRMQLAQQAFTYDSCVAGSFDNCGPVQKGSNIFNWYPADKNPTSVAVNTRAKFKLSGSSKVFLQDQGVAAILFKPGTFLDRNLGAQGNPVNVPSLVDRQGAAIGKDPPTDIFFENDTDTPFSLADLSYRLVDDRAPLSSLDYVPGGLGNDLPDTSLLTATSPDNLVQVLFGLPMNDGQFLQIEGTIFDGANPSVPEGTFIYQVSNIETVPEPANAILAGSGCLLLVLFRRLRQRRRAQSVVSHR